MDSRNLWTGAVGVVLGAAVISWSNQLDALPAAFPLVVSVLLVVLGAVTLGKELIVLVRDQSARAQIRDGFSGIEWQRQVRIIVPLVAAIVYTRFFKVVGFVALTPFLLIGMATYLGYKKIWITTVVGIGATALIYVVFRLLLGIPLPRVPYLGI